MADLGNPVDDESRDDTGGPATHPYLTLPMLAYVILGEGDMSRL